MPKGSNHDPVLLGERTNEFQAERLHYLILDNDVSRSVK